MQSAARLPSVVILSFFCGSFTQITSASRPSGRPVCRCNPLTTRWSCRTPVVHLCWLTAVFTVPRRRVSSKLIYANHQCQSSMISQVSSTDSQWLSHNALRIRPPLTMSSRQWYAAYTAYSHRRSFIVRLG